MHSRRKTRIIEWLLGVLFLGSLLTPIGVYIAKSTALHNQHNQVVKTVATAFNIEISDNAAVIYELDNYSVVLPTPAATDGDSEFVIRVSSEEVAAAIRSLKNDTDGDPQIGKHALPPWQSLNSCFRVQLGTGIGFLRFYVRDRWDSGEISNCELLIVNPSERLLGYYRWDQ